MAQLVACVRVVSLISRADLNLSKPASGDQRLHKRSLIKSFLSPRAGGTDGILTNGLARSPRRSAIGQRSFADPKSLLRRPPAETALRVLMKYPGGGGRASDRQTVKPFLPTVFRIHRRNEHGSSGRGGESRGEKVREYKPRRNN